MKSKPRSLLWSKLFLLFTCSLISLSTFAQSAKITVTGIVRDQQGEPLIGVSIKELNSINGTITDIDGHYQITVPSNAVLEFTYVGFSRQEITVNGKKSLSVIMTTNEESLKDIVVIGYGGVKKQDLTGSVIAIKAEEMNRGAVTSAQELMQGKIPGVFIIPGNGQPGAGATMRIRSGASLNASNDPLIVIDGVPIGNDAAPGMSNPLSSINPNDIESMTILKDASATAIYGSRASNGVIIITTKKGAKGALKINYSSTYSISDPYKKTKTLDAASFREEVSRVFKDNEIAQSILNEYPDTSTNWQDLIYRTAFGTDQNLSISGNTLDIPFRVSMGYNNTDGTLKTSNFERYTANVSLSPQFFNKHLSVELNLKGVINDNQFANTGAIGAAAFFDPTKPIYNTDNRYNGYWNWTTASGVPNTEAIVNPVGALYDRFDSGRTRRSMGNIKVDYKLHFLPDLRASVNLGYDVAKGKGSNGPNNGSFDAVKNTTFPGVGIKNRWENFRRNNIFESYLTYDKELKSLKSRINLMGGYSWQHFYYSNLNMAYSPYDEAHPVTSIPSGWNVDDEQQMYIQDGSYKKPGENYLISWYGRLNYVFSDKYLFTATLRRDGSSKFPENNRWGLFPSFALAWNLSDEDFMKEFKVLSTAKVRLGYGQTGQQDIDDYQYINTYYLGTNPESTYLGEYLMKPGKYNPNLKWETTTTYNIGVDYGFLNNRINGSIDVYKKKTKDLLSIVNVAAGTNFSNLLWTNIGNMNNKGVEFNINANIIESKDFTWSSGFNFTWNKSEITKLLYKADENYRGTDQGDYQKHMIGYAPYTFYLYQQVYDENGKPIQDAFVDLDGDGAITEADRYFVKSPRPEYYLGFNSKFIYKNFDLGFNLRSNLGNYVYNKTAADNSTISNAYSGQRFLTNLHETVFETGFTRSLTVPQRTSDYFLENASFLKIDNLTFGYSFNKLFTEKLSGRISFSVQNVFTITNYKGLDPECDGVDNNIWPRPRTYTLGLNLNF